MMKSRGSRTEPWEHRKRRYTRRTGHYHIWHRSSEM